jgi:23S rRNA (cytosine1962-C5)-methyltransferase
MNGARVVLRARRARPFFGRHPWVYAGAIDHVEGNPADGAAVDLYSHEGEFIAHGLWNSHSKIRVRLYSWSPDIPLDDNFFRERLTTAVHLRTAVLGLNQPGRACRLVFSEGDGLSGLTVDRYDRWLVAQFTALGLAVRREMLVELLAELCQPEGIYLRTERGIGGLEGLELQDGLLWGAVPTEPIEIEEAGVRFLVSLTLGQKTGFYLDQRDNRAAVVRFAAGRRVLDAFCYTGAFGLHAARAGAAAVECVDASLPALTLAQENARLNGLTNVSFAQADVFDYLERQVAAALSYDLIVLDPPKFARAQNAVDEALRGYRRLQGLAIRLLPVGGILVTCCCSGLITQDMLIEQLAELAAEQGRDIQILERRGQASDHPISVACLESSYLKCLICRVR